mgnify:CR=1 FL=1
MRHLLILLLTFIILTTPVWGTYAIAVLIPAEGLAVGLGALNLSLGCLLWPAVAFWFTELTIEKFEV